MRAALGVICAATLMGVVACGDDDGGDDGTAVLCKAGELIVTAVAGRFDVRVPGGLDNACVGAVAAYQAQRSPLLVELTDGSTLTIPMSPQVPEVPATWSPEFQQLLDELMNNGATVHSGQ